MANREEFKKLTTQIIEILRDLLKDQVSPRGGQLLCDSAEDGEISGERKVAHRAFSGKQQEKGGQSER